eukprot:Platyproteum_vivax@DN4967_c0_g1_i1.p1
MAPKRRNKNEADVVDENDDLNGNLVRYKDIQQHLEVAGGKVILHKSEDCKASIFQVPLRSCRGPSCPSPSEQLIFVNSCEPRRLRLVLKDADNNETEQTIDKFSHCLIPANWRYSMLNTSRTDVVEYILFKGL